MAIDPAEQYEVQCKAVSRLGADRFAKLCGFEISRLDEGFCVIPIDGWAKLATALKDEGDFSLAERLEWAAGD